MLETKLLSMNKVAFIHCRQNSFDDLVYRCLRTIVVI